MRASRLSSVWPGERRCHVGRFPIELRWAPFQTAIGRDGRADVDLAALLVGAALRRGEPQEALGEV
eukprot:scaffold630292_cov37-Prasinocladus_malaysianus.AAC.1